MKASQNPYRVQQLEELLQYDPALVGSSWGKVKRSLSHGSGAVVGCKGSGKTSLLEGYVARVDGEMKVRMWRLEQGVAAGDLLDEVEGWLTSGDLAIVDSAGLLNFWQARRLRQLARRKRVIVSLHEQCRHWQTLWRCQSNAALLVSLNRRLGQGEMPQGEAEELLQRCCGNIRMCFHALYDGVS